MCLNGALSGDALSKNGKKNLPSPSFLMTSHRTQMLHPTRISVGGWKGAIVGILLPVPDERDVCSSHL